MHQQPGSLSMKSFRTEALSIPQCLSFSSPEITLSCQLPFSTLRSNARSTGKIKRQDQPAKLMLRCLRSLLASPAAHAGHSALTLSRLRGYGQQLAELQGNIWSFATSPSAPRRQRCYSCLAGEVCAKTLASQGDFSANCAPVAITPTTRSNHLRGRRSCDMQRPGRIIRSSENYFQRRASTPLRISPISQLNNSSIKAAAMVTQNA